MHDGLCLMWDISDVKNLCICVWPLTFWTLLFTPAVTVAARCTLLKWKHPPHRSLNFYPVLSSQHCIGYLWNPFQLFWHKHKTQSARFLTTQGAYLNHLALEPLKKCCLFISHGVTTWKCITHGSSKVPSRTKTPDNLSGGEFSKTPQIVLLLLVQLFTEPHSHFQV